MENKQTSDSSKNSFHHKEQYSIQKQKKCKSSSRLWNADRTCLNTFNESNVTKNTQRQNENCYVNTEESSVFEKTLKESEIRGLLNELSLKPVKKNERL